MNMPKEVSDAMLVLYKHGYVAKLEMRTAFNATLFKGEPEREEECRETALRDIGRDIGRFIVKDKEHLLNHKSGLMIEQHGWEWNIYWMHVIRAKPDLELDRRLAEETMRELGF